MADAKMPRKIKAGCIDFNQELLTAQKAVSSFMHSRVSPPGGSGDAKRRFSVEHHGPHVVTEALELFTGQVRRIWPICRLPIIEF